jgi:Cd2+/Zn2+-exporting ATPase
MTIMAGILTAVGLFSQHGMNNMLIANSAYGLATLIAGLPILTKAISALQAWVMSIELLVSIAVVGAVAILELEEAAMVTFLFVLGNLLEQRTLQRTHRAIQNLTEMQPTTATIVVNGQQQVVEIDDVEEGAVLVVRVGDQVPVDGQIISGEAEIDEALITGESKLVEKTSGDQAYMGSIVENGQILVQAQKVGEDTTFGKIIELVEEAQDNQAPMSKMIDRFAKYYTPFVLVLAILIFAITRNLRLAITILVLACPGALVIGAPVSNVAGIGRGAKAGILIKGGSVIDQLSQVDTILFDKTGTVTEGRPTVKSIKEYQGDGWLKLAASLEKQTNHPLARSIVEYYEKRTQTVIDDIQIPITTVKGTGIQSKYQGETIWIGSQRILTNQPIELTAQQKTDLQTIEEEGQSVVLMTADNQLVLMIGLIDQVRPDVKSTFEKLKQNGIVQQWMLTGDHTVIAKKVARSIGIEQVKAQMLPEDKAQFLEQLQKQGHYVLFVGDGINDSPSIAKANVGIAMGSGTDVAIETSDVVLIDSEFSNIQNARRIAKATMRNTMQNVSIAIGTVMLLLIGVVYGWVNMASGMLFHEVSILIVIFNAMRLLRMKF